MIGGDCGGRDKGFYMVFRACVWGWKFERIDGWMFPPKFLLFLDLYIGQG